MAQGAGWLAAGGDEVTQGRLAHCSSAAVGRSSLWGADGGSLQLLGGLLRGGHASAGGQEASKCGVLQWRERGVNDSLVDLGKKKGDGSDLTQRPFSPSSLRVVACSGVFQVWICESYRNMGSVLGRSVKGVE